MPEVVVHVGASHTQTSFLAGSPVASGGSAGRIVSAPDLAGDETKVERLLTSLPGPPGRAVLVIRDLHRQLPVLWQGELLRGGTASFEEFVDRLAADHESLSGPWRSIDPVVTLQPWDRRIGGDHVHVVTAPLPGRLDELWRRFTEAAGNREDEVRTDASPRQRPAIELADRMMSPAAAEVLRALNVLTAAGTDGRFVPDEPSVRQALVEGLGLTSDDTALWTHPAVADWSAEGRERLEACGYVVHGSLDELTPGAPTAPGPATDEAELDAAVGALRSLVQLTATLSPHRADSAMTTRLKTTIDSVRQHWLPQQWQARR